MKRYSLFFLLFSVASLVLAALPYGAVCNFASPDGAIRRTFSYFSLTPFGYANFGPFCTACLLCVLLVFAVLFQFGVGKKIKTAALVTASLAFLASVLPLMYGIRFYSAVGAAISALTLLQIICLIMIRKKEGKP